MGKVLGCAVVAIIAIVIGFGINALLAIPITWALDSFTPWHLNWLTVFVALCIIAVVFGGGRAATK